MDTVKTGFYSFFQAEAAPYPETLDTLTALRQAGIKTGVLTDVAYGMDNKFSMQDIAVLSGFLDVALTSVDVGYRKPNSAGFQTLMTALQVSPDEMMYGGDEQKDIVGDT
ncbi:MAG: HAD hydrolase-like protein [Lachnospiraceae bacterium]|nr:HAD hydrolase-like protein [Lachnospiraceae bacterium]